jgi:outer membrane protein assembly factor BamB
VAVAGGRVYVQDSKGGNERLVCFTAADGKQLWADEYPADYAGKLGGYAAGPRATPTIHDGRAYTVGALGKFRCVKLNGDAPPELAWERDLLGEYGGNLQAEEMRWGFAGSPVVDGDLVVVAAGGKWGSVAAFDRTSGEPRWAVGETLGAYSTPVVGTFGGVRQVVAMTGGSVVGIGLPDGKMLWEYPWKTQYNMNAASPLVVGEYVFVSSDYDHGCAVLRVEGNAAKPVYFKKGKNGLKTKHSTAVHRDGFVYGFDGAVLKCMNLREGTFVPEWEAGGGVGTVTLVGDKLLVQFQGGGLHLYDADPKELTPRGSVEATGGNSWATPAVLNGRIYTRDAGSVVCVDATK